MRSNRSRDEFEAAVDTAKDHIAAGDVFQLVISQRLETEVPQSPLELYRSLRMVNPSPYMACLLYTSPSPRDKRQSRMPSSA